MENKSRTYLVVIVLLLAVVFAGLLSYYFYNRQASQSMTPQNITPVTEQSESMIDTGPKKGDLEYQEPQTTIEIGTEGVAKGNFDKVEGNNIFIKSDNTLTQYPLTKDEIALSCTTQDLAAATELDFNMVQEVKIATPATLGSLVPANEFVVVFAQDVQGVNTVHTVALDAAKCAPQGAAE